MRKNWYLKKKEVIDNGHVMKVFILSRKYSASRRIVCQCKTLIKKHDYEISFYKRILKIETMFCQFQNFSFQKAINSACIHPRKERLCRSQITFVK